MLVSELNAISRPADTAVRNGPSLAYTQTATIGPNTRIQLRGRTPPGDWVYGCCVNNQELFWIRQAFVTITDNPLPPGVPEDANPNDPRYLPIQTQDASLPVRPIPTGIPPSDFPLARYDVRNTGRVPSLPQPPFAPKWTNAGQAGGDFSSPAAIRGNTLIAGSRDSQLYGLYTEAGNQLWRYDLQGVVQFTPAIQDGLIYVTYNGNRAAALQEQGTLYWQSDLPANTTTAFQIWLDTLFVGAGDGADARLIALRRDNPGERREFTTPVSRVQLPAVGQETIFVGADRLWALDSNFFLLNEPEVVWTSNDVTNITVPPVYSYPGVVRLAELYVADAGNNVHALDANTGARFWTQPMGAAITSLALNDNSLFVVGSGYVRALSRTDGQTLWSQPLNDNVPGRRAGDQRSAAHRT